MSSAPDLSTIKGGVKALFELIDKARLRAAFD